MSKTIVSVADLGAPKSFSALPSVTPECDSAAPARVAPGVNRRVLMNMLVSTSAAAVAAAPFAAEAAPVESADAELVALGRELLVAWGHENQVFAIAPNTPAGQGACNAASDATAAVVSEIEAIPARSLAGLRVKVLALHWTSAGECLADDELKNATTDDRLIDQIVRDVLDMPPKFEGIPNQPVSNARRLIAEAESDPVLVAIAKWESTKERMDEAGKVHSAAESAVQARGPRSRFVEFDGVRYSRLEDLDAHFKGALTRKDVLEIVRNLKAKTQPLSAEALAKRQSAFDAARTELRRILLADQRAHREARVAQAEAAWNKALSEEERHQLGVLASEPTTSTGAIALLKFAARRDDCPAEIADAIRNAVVAL
jgi:putative ubiquitin-RnfH superfamily antitoxin RatB of RatAB toxin-antitoxin module